MILGEWVVYDGKFESRESIMVNGAWKKYIKVSYEFMKGEM